MKKLLSILLTVAMLACMLPVFAVSAATNYDVPAATIDGEAATGYSACANKPWESTADSLINGGEGGGIFLFDKKSQAGTIEVTIDKTKGGDCGVVFGLQGDSNDFWENAVQYYFVFVIDAGEVLLAKCGEGLGWTWLKAIPIPNFNKADTDLKVEWNGSGRIQITTNGTKVYDFCDNKPLTGDRFGLRAGFPGCVFKDIKVTTADVTNEGAQGGVALPFATSNGKAVTGYLTAGPWIGDQPDCTITDTGLTTNRWTNMLMVEDQMALKSGSSITAVVGTPAGRAPDLTGIFFGMEGTKNGGTWCHIDSNGRYYQLYINGAGQLVLSVNTDAESNFQTLAGGNSETVIEGFAHGGTATLKAEFVDNADGSVTIKGYANDVQLIEYTDATPCVGARYGFMARENGSTLGALTVAYACEHTNTEVVGAKEATETEKGYTGDTVCKDCGETLRTGEETPVKTPTVVDPVPTGDVAALAGAMAVLAIIGTGVIVSKKRHF
jgi:hypothetical protein